MGLGGGTTWQELSAVLLSVTPREGHVLEERSYKQIANNILINRVPTMSPSRSEVATLQSERRRKVPILIPYEL